jgi:hypothetical protein
MNNILESKELNKTYVVNNKTEHNILKNVNLHCSTISVEWTM